MSLLKKNYSANNWKEKKTLIRKPLRGVPSSLFHEQQ